MKTTRIVIAGGGFAGLYAAKYLDKRLAGHVDVEVTLISRENFILFTRVLHEVAAGDLIHTSSRPHVAVLGRIPGTRRFSDCERHQDNQLIPGVMIFRPESGLVYFNVDNVVDIILSRVRTEPTPPKLLVLDLSAAPLVDMQSAYALAGMADELVAERIRFQAVEPRSSVRDRLRHEGVDSKLGGVNRFTSVADAIDHFQATAIKPP